MLSARKLEAGSGALKKRKLDEKLVSGILFVLPALALVLVFLVLPVIMSFRYSLTNWNGVSTEYQFIGFENFKNVIASSEFKTLFKNTFYLIILYVPVLNILALLFAVIIYDIGKLANVYKVILFLPNIISMVVVGFIWRTIYNPATGPLAFILDKVGLGFLIQDWIGQKQTVMPALSVSIIWFAVGFYVLIYLGGLSTVPAELYEAADVDGISWWQRLFKITIPLIAQSITINIIVSTIAILTLFDLPYVLTQGGPGYASQTMALMSYQYAFKAMSQGKAMALAVMLTIITILFSIVELFFLRRKEDY
ncbi:carbohydrate ABC transporter permease [Youxingia wuxianensis]|uniref:Sugar ABC transporter permease n=1 Tax=Youxingia wuxianensis TaxID=2763678 RepID=A0A926ERW2_9FIRM|nr:sugar ABC transporter permease [Youxingia wuxianensis]MBC8585364.1 sugar ABC transporter permease [Youxingia wuxianensis]